MYVSHLCPSLSIWGLHKRSWSYPIKKLLIVSVNGVMCYYPKCIILQGNCHVRGININISKLEWRIGVQQFLSQALKGFHKLWFGLVCCWKMWCRFFLCWCHKHLLNNLFLFGDVNNASRPWVASLQGHIIILRIQIMCTLHVEGYTMG